jgi:hypothetical protein
MVLPALLSGLQEQGSRHAFFFLHVTAWDHRERYFVLGKGTRKMAVQGPFWVRTVRCFAPATPVGAFAQDKTFWTELFEHALGFWRSQRKEWQKALDLVHETLQTSCEDVMSVAHAFFAEWRKDKETP